MRDLIRRLASLTLRLFPTCELQWELERRPGVERIVLGLGEVGALQVGNADQHRVRGPCTITLNRD